MGQKGSIRACRCYELTLINLHLSSAIMRNILGRPRNTSTVTGDFCLYSFCISLLCRTYTRLSKLVNCSALVRSQWFIGICGNVDLLRPQGWSYPIGNCFGNIGKCFDLKKHFPGLLREESEVRIRRVLQYPQKGSTRGDRILYLLLLYNIMSAPREVIHYLDNCFSILGQTTSPLFLRYGVDGRVHTQEVKEYSPETCSMCGEEAGMSWQMQLQTCPLISVFLYIQYFCQCVPIQGHSSQLQSTNTCTFCSQNLIVNLNYLT